jgi:hypothetical protein
MDLSGFIDKLLLSISEEISKKTKSLEEGNAKDYEHYRYLVGYIDGLKLSKSTINDLKKKYLYGDMDLMIETIISRVSN